MQHIQDAHWVPGPLELPLLFPAPGPIATTPWENSHDLGGCTTRDSPSFGTVHRALLRTVLARDIVDCTIPAECVAYTGLPWYFHNSIVLINLELLVDTEQWKWNETAEDAVLRPGCQHLASLLSLHRLAVFCPWSMIAARSAARSLNDLLQNHVEVRLLSGAMMFVSLCSL